MPYNPTHFLGQYWAFKPSKRGTSNYQIKVSIEFDIKIWFSVFWSRTEPGVIRIITGPWCKIDWGPLSWSTVFGYYPHLEPNHTAKILVAFVETLLYGTYICDA